MRFIVSLLLILYVNANAQKILKQDILGASYTIDNQEVTKKFRSNIFTYKNILLGNLTNLDVVNPLQLVLFYKQQNTIVILDNQLNAINTIDFNKLSQPIQAFYAGLASQNQIWLFNSNDKRVYLYNILQHKIKSITNVIESEVVWIASDLNNLYFLNSENELLEINLYGTITLLTKFTNAVIITYFDKTFTVTHQIPQQEIQKLKLNKGKLIPLNP